VSVKEINKPFQMFGNWRTLSGLIITFIVIPGLSLCSNPGLKLANAFGVLSN